MSSRSANGTPWVLAAPLADDLSEIADILLRGRPIDPKKAATLHAAAGLLRDADRAFREGRLR